MCRFESGRPLQQVLSYSARDPSRIELPTLDKCLTCEAPIRPRDRLADLMAEMSERLPCVDGWDEMCGDALK